MGIAIFLSVIAAFVIGTAAGSVYSAAGRRRDRMKLADRYSRVIYAARTVVHTPYDGPDMPLNQELLRTQLDHLSQKELEG